MLIRPGWGGQQMNPDLLEKVTRLREISDKSNLSLNIEVDGGVKSHNAKLCIDAGANILVVGSAVFNAESTPQESLTEIRNSLN
jgi:ribulose-phosphate 3-epimerase